MMDDDSDQKTERQERRRGPSTYTLSFGGIIAVAGLAAALNVDSTNLLVALLSLSFGCAAIADVVFWAGVINLAGSQAGAASGVQIRTIPRPFLLGRRNKGVTVGSIPVEAISTESDHYLGDFWKTSFFTNRIRRSLKNLEETEHHTLIGYSINVVQLSLVPHEWVGQIQFISPNPEKHVFLIPPGTLDEITMFTVTSEAIGLRVLLSVVSAIPGDVRVLAPDTVDPHVAKWIIKERGIISTWSSSGRLTPMDPVR